MTTLSYFQLTKQRCHVSSFFREATQLCTKVDLHRSSCTSTDSDQTEVPTRSQSLSEGHPGFLGSTDQQALQQRSKQPVSYTYPLSASITDSAENKSGARRRSIHTTPTCFSLNSSQQSIGGSSSALQDLNTTMNGSPVHASIASSKEHRPSMVSHIGLSRVL